MGREEYDRRYKRPQDIIGFIPDPETGMSSGHTYDDGLFSVEDQRLGGMLYFRMLSVTKLEITTPSQVFVIDRRDFLHKLSAMLYP
jgi:hypothetical protein